jgi:polyhydroxyalkanoate synthesis regulator phasin
MAEDPNDKQDRGLLYDTTRMILLAAVGAASLAQDELNGFIDKLVDRGEMAEADARKLMREVLERREKMDRERKAQGKKSAAETAATKGDVDALIARITDLTRQIEELKKEKVA